MLFLLVCMLFCRLLRRATDGRLSTPFNSPVLAKTPNRLLYLGALPPKLVSASSTPASGDDENWPDDTNTDQIISEEDQYVSHALPSLADVWGTVLSALNLNNP